MTIIIGSKSDLKQCRKGLEWLLAHNQEVTVNKLYIASQHRHTLKVQEILTSLAASATPPDAIIVGAGWANHLTGCCDAFLRYQLKNAAIPIIGVAFEDAEDSFHTKAAMLSITQVPGTKVIFEGGDSQFVGEEGFLRACEFAAQGTFPKIVLKEPPESLELSLTETLKLASEAK